MSGPIVVIGELPQGVIDRLAQHAEVTQVTDGAALHEAARSGGLQEAEALLVTGQAPIGVDIVQAAPRLRVVSLRAVGYDKVDVDACTRRGIIVCNTPGVLDEAVADLTILLTLGLARRIKAAIGAGQGADAPELGSDVRGRTLGVVGMGRIGRQVARTAHRGFGMPVLYTARRSRQELIGAQVPLDELLQRSDVVSLHVPLSPQTRGLIGRRELSLMKPSAFLVNTARAGLVDFPELEHALLTGGIAGAALDIPVHDYPTAGSRLAGLPQLLLTPHIGSATLETRTAMAEMAAENLLAVLRGGQALSSVNGEG